MIERKIVHILSHNVVMTKLSSGKNSIAFGKGLGFQKKPGMVVDEAEVKQEFLLQTSEVLEHYEHILHSVDFKIIGVVEEVIAFAQGHLEGRFSETIHSALVDHINLAIERTKRGIIISNPFTFEIQHLYANEYRVADRSVAFLNEHLDVELPQDEIAFLAMHFHSARQRKKVGKGLGEVKLIAKVLENGKKLGFRFDESLPTVLFISHLKGLLDRVQAERTLSNPLLVQIKDEYEDTFEKALIFAEWIATGLNKTVPLDEVGFLTMHLERLVERQDSLL
ncbi:PRD domain-containing protein [Paenibacillus sp. 481]|uniref:PRD domain-containing protein n=1 Tax=Paenibacillus sp. 481 TaxID=2835869 RepID=UPI001E328A47|nr:PRD domain-containing protein [Paenibacillus sp. 481]UHA74062.1 PRD domain-containing protein [Paenibacillus sp. 481]